MLMAMLCVDMESRQQPHWQINRQKDKGNMFAVTLHREVFQGCKNKQYFDNLLTCFIIIFSDFYVFQS